METNAFVVMLLPHNILTSSCPDFFLQSSRIRVDLPMHGSKPIEIQEQYDCMAEKNWDGIPI